MKSGVRGGGGVKRHEIEGDDKTFGHFSNFHGNLHHYRSSRSSKFGIFTVNWEATSVLAAQTNIQTDTQM